MGLGFSSQKRILTQLGFSMIQLLVAASIVVGAFSAGLYYFTSMRRAMKINQPDQLCRDIANTSIDRLRSKDYQITYPLHLSSGFKYSQWTRVQEFFSQNQELLRRLEWLGPMNQALLTALHAHEDLSVFERHRWPSLEIWKFVYRDLFSNGGNSVKEDRTQFGAALLAMNSLNFFTALVKTYPELANLSSETFVEAPLLSYFVLSSLPLDSSIQNLKLKFKLIPKIESAGDLSLLLSGGRYLWPLALTDPPHGVGFYGSGDREQLSDADNEGVATVALKTRDHFIKQRGVSFTFKIQVDFDVPKSLQKRSSSGSSGPSPQERVSCFSESVFSSPRHHHSFFGSTMYTEQKLHHSQGRVEIEITNLPALKEHGVFPFCSAQWDRRKKNTYEGLEWETVSHVVSDLKAVPCHKLRLYNQDPSLVTEGDSLKMVYHLVGVQNQSDSNSVYLSYYLADWAGNMVPAGTIQCTSCTPPVCLDCGPPWGPPSDPHGFRVGNSFFHDRASAEAASLRLGMPVLNQQGPNPRDAFWTGGRLPDGRTVTGIHKEIIPGDTMKSKTENLDIGYNQNPEGTNPNGVRDLIGQHDQVKSSYPAAKEQIQGLMDHIRNSGDLGSADPGNVDLKALGELMKQLEKEEKEFEDQVKKFCQTEQTKQADACKKPECTPVACSCGGTGTDCEAEPCPSSDPVSECGGYGVVMGPLTRFKPKPVPCGECPPPPAK
jgi:hypothetical protein